MPKRSLRRVAAGLIAGVLLLQTAQAAPLLLISIDGLMPGYVTEAGSYGLQLPHLRRYVREGAYARGVVGVNPTVTYPSHTTLVTGVAPARHGIVSNTTFDPLHRNQGGWYWYASDIRVPTLFSAAKKAGLRTAALNWPVTVGERAIDVLLPEIWRATTQDDLKLARALSHPPGVLESLEARLGPFVDGYIDDLESDRVRTRFSVAMLREHRPQFMVTHLIAPDGVQHREGPAVAAVYPVLEAVDAMIGEMEAAALANDPDTVIAVVSDHGFIATHTEVHLRTRFVEAGLIRPAPARIDTVAKIDAWDAQIWPAGGVAAVMLRDRKDAATRARVETLLKTLQSDPRNGLARVLSGAELTASGGFPDADFLVEFAPGFYAGSAVRGELLTPSASKGMHGYLPQRAQMHAVFFVRGNGIAARDLGVIDMQQIAPTLAQIMGVELGNTGAAALPVMRADPNAGRKGLK